MTRRPGRGEGLRPAGLPGLGGEPATPDGLADAERTHIVRVLECCRWRIERRGRAAERLGLRPSTLRNRMKRLGIHRADG